MTGNFESLTGVEEYTFTVLNCRRFIVLCLATAKKMVPFSFILSQLEERGKVLCQVWLRKGYNGLAVLESPSRARNRSPPPPSMK